MYVKKSCAKQRLYSQNTKLKVAKEAGFQYWSLFK